jgi:uncharacterized protein (TIGR02646 family)
MKQIKKNNPPDSLIEHCKKDHANYDNYPDKDLLRASLHAEQRGICCYCMSYIEPTANLMKIEHFKCQDNYPDEQLKYGNLLGACKGNEGQEDKMTHCDTFKKNMQLSFYPAAKDYAIEDLILYGNDGSVTSNNKQLNREINEVLNLNTIALKNRRKAALDGFKDGLRCYQGKIKKPTLERWLNDWKGTDHDDRLRPFCMVIVYWLQKRLKRA